MATPVGKGPEKQASSLAMKLRSHPRLHRLFRGSLKLVAFSSVAAVAALAYDYKEAKDVDKDSPKQKKKTVLVLPFHRMKLVERKTTSFDLQNALTNDEADDKLIEVEVKELVDTIHEAAQDPNIVALYGVFGHGFRFSAGGWAQVQEVRNALRVFRESHRIHWEPNLAHEAVLSRRGNSTAKPMFAYADTFANPMDPGNKEYYLASIFSHVHLQPRGELNLFGLATSNAFLRCAMDKYGVKVHVFKHGKYKNAPNMFTEKGYDRAHREQTRALLDSMNAEICEDIVQSRRGLANFDKYVWKMLNDYGTFPAPQAKTLGLVDYMPRIDPLEALLQLNKTKSDVKQALEALLQINLKESEFKQEMKNKWAFDTDANKFDAVESIPFSKYASIVEKRKKFEKRKWKHHNLMQRFAEKSAVAELLLSALGYKAPFYNIKKEDYSKEMEKSRSEKIALVTVGGAITEAVARKTVNSLRKIKKDEKVKCVILRVDSPGGSATAAETILQEFNDLPQPAVCSMGNVAASAGYFIATGCDRIFALPTTITGSIGVFGIKLDLTGMAAQYGIKVDLIVTGPHSAEYSLFQPLTKPIKTNFTRSVDRFYDYFKETVSVSRGLSLEEVQEVAQGRVWTGDQAKNVLLVDELGGLTRVIAYARQNYTSGAGADVEVWPKPTSLKDKLLKLAQDAGGNDDEDQDTSTASSLLNALVVLFRSEVLGSYTPPVYSESDMTRQFLSGLIDRTSLYDPSLGASTLPSSLSGIMMTVDETEGLRCLLQDLHGGEAAQRPLLLPDFWV